MANVCGVGEKDFEALAWAANEAKTRGDMIMANALDRIARKANAALSREKFRYMEAWCSNPTRLSWKDVPSTLM